MKNTSLHGSAQPVNARTLPRYTAAVHMAIALARAAKINNYFKSPGIIIVNERFILPLWGYSQAA